MSPQPELDPAKGNSSERDGDQGTNAAQRRLRPFEPQGRKPVDKPKGINKAKDKSQPKSANKSKATDRPRSTGKTKAPTDSSATKAASAAKPVGVKSEKKPGGSRESAIASGVPDVVSRRMVRRMALLCGIPSALGMLTFVGSYLLVINDVNLPTYAVLLVSLGWFGLGVLGLSYGVLSASWDEEVVGSRLGWDEFTTNWGRMRANWRSNAEQAKAARAEAAVAAKRAAKKAKSGQ